MVTSDHEDMHAGELETSVLLHACPELTVMATSREPLGLAGETVWRVPMLSADEAMQLFADRATQARPNFTLDESRAAVVSQICERLDGIPLALELAAARARMLTPEPHMASAGEGLITISAGRRSVSGAIWAVRSSARQYRKAS